MGRLPLHLARWLLALALLPGWSRAADSGGLAPPFDLPQRGGSQRAQLEALRRRIVVLDFFAHWCVPCVRASVEVETGVRRYYELRRGNAHGIPVDVLAVNIEASQPEKTEAFIRRTGLKQVFDDSQDDVFQKYGGSGMPFLVVIDATGGKSGDVPPQVVYRKAGFEGIAKLRAVIDVIGEAPMAQADADVGRKSPAEPPKMDELPGTQTSKTLPSATAESLASPGGKVETPGTAEGSTTLHTTQAVAVSTNASEILPPNGGEASHKFSLDFAAMLASDILLTDELLEYRQTRSGSELLLSLSHGHIGLNYVPESALEHEASLDEDCYGFQTRGRVRANDRITATVGGGVYYGYMDYRSLWFNEHFRQLFSARQGYETAHPWGYNLAGGARMEYLPAAGFVQADLVYQHDVISPGYEVSLASLPPKLVRFRANYDTISGRLTFENVLTRRLRALQELQVTDTTDRQLRFSLQSSLNYALAEHWVTRLVLSGTKESPHSLAWFASGTLERDWDETWFLSLMARYYQDNGEVENALLVENTADPPLETFQAGLGLRWQRQRSSLKLLAGPYFTHYEKVGPAISTFPHLYQNRSWFSVQLAFAHEF